MSHDDQTINFAALIELLIEFLEAEDGDEHTELNPHRFHPSQLGNTCNRQRYLDKLGLKDMSKYKGHLRVGTIIHEVIENNVPRLAENAPNLLRSIGIGPDHIDQLQIEIPLKRTVGGIELIGQCDLYDPIDNVIVDWKTKSDFYWLDRPENEHIEQLMCYLAMAEVTRGQICYIQKTDLEVATYPAQADPNNTIRFDHNVLQSLIEQAWVVRRAIETHGVATTPVEIPFDKCGCWKCEKESLALPDTEPELEPAPEHALSPPEYVEIPDTGMGSLSD